MFFNEGHKKDTKGQGQKDDVGTSSFEIKSFDQHAAFIGQKSEKITVALYMITDFLKDEEAFKWELRGKAVRFLSSINSFPRFPLVSQKELVMAETLSLLSEVLSLLRLGLSVRFISQMNYSILKDEYSSLYKTLEDRLSMNQSVDGLIFPDDFFAMNNQGNDKNKKISSRDESHTPVAGKRDFVGHDTGQGQSENKNDFHVDTDITNSFATQARGESVFGRDEDVVSLKNKDFKIANEHEFSGPSLDGKKKMRQDIILKLLKTRGSVSIKDISESISGCSEKTIQRELLSLVGGGVVRKMGERRWSKYALATRT